MTLPIRSFALVLAFTLLACGKADANDDATSSSADAPAASSSDAGLRVHIVLTGGPHAGSYDATPPGAACIDYAAAGADGLGIAYFADPTKVKTGIGQIDFGVNKMSEGRAGTKNFGFTVTLADASPAGGDYALHPDRGQGTGTATVAGSGPRYTVKVSGKTAEGYGVDATLDCLK